MAFLANRFARFAPETAAALKAATRNGHFAAMAVSMRQIHVALLAINVLQLLAVATQNYWAAFGLGAGLLCLWIAIARWPMARWAPYTMGIASMLTAITSATFLQARTDAHFHVVASLGLLAFYRNWRVLGVAMLTGLVVSLVNQDAIVGSNWELKSKLIFTFGFLSVVCIKLQRNLYEICFQQALARHKIQELQSTHQQLVQASKLASIGTLAGGMAHELNNPLAIISGYAQSLLRALNKQPPIEPATQTKLAKIIENCGRMKQIILQLRTFAEHTTKSEWEAIDMDNLLARVTLSHSEGLTDSGIVLETLRSEHPAAVLGDENQLLNVLRHLIANSVDAFASLATEDQRERRITIGIKTPTVGGVQIHYEDNAGGMSEETCARIFEPFFTTKEIGKGTGLGMAVVHGIITAHGGKIRVDSKLGHGSKFLIDFPAAVAPPAVALNPVDTDHTTASAS